MNYIDGEESGCDVGWASHEFDKTNFGNVRRKKRLVKVADDLSASLRLRRSDCDKVTTIPEIY